MILRGSTGDALEIALDAYRDAAWLEVRVDAVTGNRAWALPDPSLSAEEVERLAGWLEHGDEAALELAQPPLRFERSGGAIFVAFEDGKRIELDADDIAVREAASALREQLARLPRPE